MDTFRKWLNKPKADDKSLLARFYHADRSLSAVASELDSFDGRAEPDRCSRLVSRLRQNQDKVLAITNLIMEELLGEDRDQRAFRAKFPEEVLQENLAGQLWFGAECLAAGSSIMNREWESREMRPLAQAVTKSLGNVRILLRDQCLRNNVPNSKTLHLDINDSATEQLYESLKIFDRLFAEFELSYVSAMVQVKTKHEYEMQELICVLFSETLQRALKTGLLDQDKVDAFDPALMFSIPRLAIVAGLVIYPNGPLDMDMPADLLSEMFRPFRIILIKMRALLRDLKKHHLYELEKLLCTNEDINSKVPVGTSSIEAPSPDQQNNNNKLTDQINELRINNTNNNDNISTSLMETKNHPSNTRTKKSNQKTNHNNNNNNNNVGNTTSSASFPSRCATSSPSILSVSAVSTPTTSPMPSPTPSHSLASTSSATTRSTTSPVDWTDDDLDSDDSVDDDDDSYDDNTQRPKDINNANAECASGYLIPNTNFGNLLQPQQVPLTDNFIASEDEFSNLHIDTAMLDVDLPTTSGAVLANAVGNMTTTSSSSAQYDNFVKQSPPTSHSVGDEKNPFSDCETGSTSCDSLLQQHDRHCNSSRSSSNRSHSHRHSQHSHSHRHHHHHHHHHQHPHRSSRTHPSNHSSRSSKRCSVEDCQENRSQADEVSMDGTSKLNDNGDIPNDTSSADASTASSLSDGDHTDVVLAMRSTSRSNIKRIEYLLHRLFVCIAGVADQLQTNFASDLRQILRSVFLMNMSVAHEQIDIPEKQKESELFEFRASENDVIQESAGSNQSIYSAEEVNPEFDSVFNNSSGGGSTTERHSTGATIQRNNTIDLATDNHESTTTTTTAEITRNIVARSRSLGDQECTESTFHQQQQQQQQQRNRNNSICSNSPTTHSPASSTTSSEQNSPISTRIANRNNNSNSIIDSPSTVNSASHTRLSPPAWIPDGKAPRCMSCQTQFTAFRRRHHCRNCGGVFCGVCSNATAPLPKYGLTKAVRVCRDCYKRELRTNDNVGHAHHQTQSPLHSQTAGGS